MRKTFTVLFLAAFILCLAACGNAGVASVYSGFAASSSASSSTAASSSAVASSDVVASLPPNSAVPSAATKPESTQGGLAVPESSFINKSLLLFPGKNSSEIKQAFGEGYFYIDIGSMAAGLEYYNPYICFYIDNNSHGGLGKDVVEVDPFEASIFVQGIELRADYDISNNVVTNQDSLRNLFITEEQITYELLLKELGQAPELVHETNAYYSQITEYQMNAEWDTLPSGACNADYIIDGANVKVRFIKDKDSYVALHAHIG